MLGTDKVHRVYITLDNPGTRALESQLMKQNIHGYEIASWFNLDKRKKDNYVLYLFFKSVISTDDSRISAVLSVFSAVL